MLLLKSWRDVLVRKGQFIALIVLVALGITSYVSFVSGYQDIHTSAEASYRQLKFEDFTTQVLGAPKGVVQTIRRLPGVAAAEGELVVDTPLDLDPRTQMTARVVGVPVDHRLTVNSVLVFEGNYLGGRPNEALLHRILADRRGIQIGDKLTLEILGQKRSVRIVGTGTDPDYFYPARSKADATGPDEFTILWMAQPDVERLFHKPGTYTNISVRVTPGTNQNVLISRIEKILKPYGVVDTVKRADQPSNFLLQQKLSGIQAEAYLMPAFILAISSLSLAIALSRLVQSQRGEIGLAKALGYRDWQLLVHYLFFCVFIALTGSVIGFILGQLAAAQITRLYATFFTIPYLAHEVHMNVVLGSILISTASCVVAGLVPAYRSAQMPPARAMHADPNIALPQTRMPLLEKAFGWAIPRSFTFRVPLRNVFRAKRRSLYTVVGISFALILTVATWSLFDSLTFMVNWQLGTAERWDMLAAFNKNFYGDRPREIRFWQGVSKVQPVLIVPVTLRANGNLHDGAVTAMAPNDTFHGFDIVSGAPVQRAIAEDGLIMTPPIAKKLGVEVGDTVSVESPYIQEARRIKVAALSDELWGSPLFTSLDQGRQLADSPTQVYNALYLNVNPRFAQAIKRRLEGLTGVLTVQARGGIAKLINQYLGLYYTMGGILLAFGWSIAFVVIYTTFTANIMERTREIGTMLTIGEDRWHLATMITIENVMLAIVGIPLGVWMGVGAAQALFSSASTEAYTLRAVIFPLSVVYVVISLIIVLLLSEIPPIRRIFRLDLAEATKIME